MSVVWKVYLTGDMEFFFACCYSLISSTLAFEAAVGANNLELVVVVAMVFYLPLLPIIISEVFTVLLIVVFRIVLLARWFW